VSYEENLAASVFVFVNYPVPVRTGIGTGSNYDLKKNTFPPFF
jgi:hypothetical protein